MKISIAATLKRLAAALAVAGLGAAGSASATLLDRGPLMVYDTALDITWTRQAGDGVGRPWTDANAWAASLVIGVFDDWRLPWASVSAQGGPATSVVNCSSATETACRDNEMGYMFYYNLDGDLGNNKTGNQTAVGGEVLTGIQLGYWSGTERFPASPGNANSGFAWLFNFAVGIQGAEPEVGFLHAWAVRPGDVAAVPEPASLLLIGIGALGLGWARRKGRRR